MESRQSGNENGVGCTTSWQIGRGQQGTVDYLWWEKVELSVPRKTSPDFGARGKKGLRGHLGQGFTHCPLTYIAAEW